MTTEQRTRRRREVSDVLVVEDDADVLAAVTELLEEEGYPVKTSKTAGDALSLLEKGLRPAAMVIDVMMPRMSGVELLHACSSHSDLAEVPAILMSASATRDLERPGVTLFLRKPFAPETLLEQLERMLESPTPRAVEIEPRA